MGAEGRYEDYVYLDLIEREWKRDLTNVNKILSFSDSQPSPRAMVVIAFWTYFETRIERLLRAGMRDVPSRLLDDSLRRNLAIGTRLTEFYKIVFNCTYFEDLESLGYLAVGSHLKTIQKRRNEFAHGRPEAIDEKLVEAVVKNLRTEHESCIAVFNKRGTIQSRRN